MRYILFFIYMLGISSALFAQTIEQKVADEVCACLGEIGEDEVEGKIKRCLPSALAKVLDEGTEKEKNSLSTVGDVQRAMFKAKELMAESCSVVRQLVLKNKKNNYYIPSSSPKANEYYLEGNELMANSHYSKAARRYKKAIKADDKFVLAIDQLAMAYRELKDYKESIMWCERSLSIFPEGDVALRNIAIAYSLSNEQEKSLEYFKKLNRLYPNDPEGFYGVAQVSLLTEHYEIALDNILIAHKMFVLGGAEKARESQEIINALYLKFNELDKSDAFFSRTDKLGIELSLDEK